ncbi:MAG: hypothetical protein ABJB11_22165 [Ferruginibacter sp.]
MNYSKLWEQSSRLQKHSTVVIDSGGKLFTHGARWMHAQLDDMRDTKTTFDEQTNFEFYGWMKYGVSVGAGLVSAIFLYRLHPLLSPLAVLMFYFCEVQMLFLFPLLIDKVPNPFYASIRETAAIGALKAMMIIIPVSIRMLLGLFNRKAPLLNWYTGCLVVVTWYQHEIRNRLK